MTDNIARRDFEIYASGVKRLEELEKEINLLKIDRKFPSEAASIRSKLKHVSEIPQIEYELKLLKEKISGKAVKKPILKCVTENKINELKKEIEKKSEQCKRFMPLSKEVLGLKLEIAAMEKKIKMYEGEKKRKHDILKNINPEVNKVFEDTFNLSLNDIKAKLAKEVENKEAEVQKELQRDIARREEIFNERYNELEKEFQKKYNEKVRNALEKEVKEKADKIISEAIKKKEEVSEKEFADLKRKLNSDFNLKEKTLQEHFKKDIEEEKRIQKEKMNEELLGHKVKIHKKLDSEFAKEVLNIREKQKKNETEIIEQLQTLTALKEDMRKKIMNEEEKLSERDKLNQKLAETEKKKTEYLESLNVKHQELERQIKKLNSAKNRLATNKLKIGAERDEFENKKKIESSNIAKEREKLEDEKISLRQTASKHEEDLKKKAEEIKASLQKEYEDKLKEAIKNKEQEFKDKGLELEKEIENKVKMLFD